MANDKITMLKLKRMLQLLDAGKSLNEICRDLHMSKRTVHNYKQRACLEVVTHIILLLFITRKDTDFTDICTQKSIENCIPETTCAPCYQERLSFKN